MNTVRAHKIADAFSAINSFSIDTAQHGIQVHYLNHRAFFEHEAQFWEFAFKLGQVNHEEGQVSEIESELTIQ